MESLQSRELGFAQTDYADRLLKADGLLGSLNVECGGRIGATLAIPELLDIVVKHGHALGLKVYGNVRLEMKFVAGQNAL